jgi:hypothetical protein
MSSGSAEYTHTHGVDFGNSTHLLRIEVAVLSAPHDGKRGERAEVVSAVRLVARLAAKTAVKSLASQQEILDAFEQHGRQDVQQRRDRDHRVRRSRVHFAAIASPTNP